MPLMALGSGPENFGGAVHPCKMLGGFTPLPIDLETPPFASICLQYESVASHISFVLMQSSCSTTELRVGA
jgi:hypothetical protein